MTRKYRFLSTAVAESPEDIAVKSDFVFILAALLCALVCVVGLIAVAHCAWIRRRRSMANRSPVQPSTANKGIEKKFVDTLPKFVYNSAKEDDKGKVSSGECVICLAEYADGDEIRVLPQCGHGFHIGCIDKWLGSHSSCPSCRQIVVIGKCKKCGGFPATAAGEIPVVVVVEHESRQDNISASSSISKVELIK